MFSVCSPAVIPLFPMALRERHIDQSVTVHC
jgi:hypothetical protein